MKNGGRISQVEKTAGFLWLELPGMDFSDCYLNDHGVVVVSNSCPSREDEPDFTDGGIGYRLRGLMAERATTARDAVWIAGELIERFGYTGSGRTYCIADPNEAWALAVVRGKHWVAQRVGDEEVMVLPNNYTIDRVDLSDSKNFMGSPDLIEYAVRKGWYEEERDGEFSFRETYAARGSVKHQGNVGRAYGAYHLLGQDYTIESDFPFSFKPNHKIDKQDLMKLLEYHYEGTDLDKTKNYTLGSPYELNGAMICNIASVHGSVTELRNWLPQEIGCVMWLAPQWPDIQPYIPWYCGHRVIPPMFARRGYLVQGLADHYEPPEDIHVRNDQHAFWAFVNFSEMMNQNYGSAIQKVRWNKYRVEKKLIREQPRLEQKMQKLYSANPEEAILFLTDYTNKLVESSLKHTVKQLKSHTK